MSPRRADLRGVVTGGAGSRWLPASGPVLWLGGGGLLLAAIFASLAVGTGEVAVDDVVGALFAFDGSPPQVVVRTSRLPRTLAGMSVGGALAVAGAVMQALTRNPLAAPGILGVNHGAALAAVVGLAWLDGPVGGSALIPLLGAGIAALLVYVLGSLGRGGLTPLKLTVAGAALAALLAAVIQGLLVVSEQSLDQSRRWLAGSLSDLELETLVEMGPELVVGVLLALGLARALTTFSLGEHIARGLGQRTGWVKLSAGLAVVLLAGAAVAVAGPISFVGLAVPHVSRALVGRDYRRLVPHTALHGAVLLLLADVAARLVIPPRELPVGVMTALVGVPFFIHLARRESAW